eukprot:jgi/Mesen1/10668/ME000009S10454
MALVSKTLVCQQLQQLPSSICKQKSCQLDEQFCGTLRRTSKLNASASTIWVSCSPAERHGRLCRGPRLSSRTTSLPGVGSSLQSLCPKRSDVQTRAYSASGSSSWHQDATSPRGRKEQTEVFFTFLRELARDTVRNIVGFGPFLMAQPGQLKHLHWTPLSEMGAGEVALQDTMHFSVFFLPLLLLLLLLLVLSFPSWPRAKITLLTAVAVLGLMVFLATVDSTFTYLLAVAVRRRP